MYYINEVLCKACKIKFSVQNLFSMSFWDENNEFNFYAHNECHNKCHGFTGIGLNVNNEKPTTSLNTILSELSVGGYQFQREDILAAFFNKFEKFYGLFVNQGTVLIIA